MFNLGQGMSQAYLALNETNMKGFIEPHYRAVSGAIVPMLINLSTISIVNNRSCIYCLRGDSDGKYEETYEEIKAKIEEATK